MNTPVPDPEGAPPTYPFAAESDPPLMPDSKSLTVKLPPPRPMLAVPETVTPPFRLIQPPAAAEMAPWQFTESERDPLPENPCPAAIVSGVPTLCSRPALV